MSQPKAVAGERVPSPLGRDRLLRPSSGGTAAPQSVDVFVFFEFSVGLCCDGSPIPNSYEGRNEQS